MNKAAFWDVYCETDDVIRAIDEIKENEGMQGMDVFYLEFRLCWEEQGFDQ